MIEHMIDRLKLAKRPDQIILCTSPLEEDRPLVEIAKQEGIESFSGDPEDVLLRLTRAAEKFGVDTVINCTADNPFVDPEYMDRLVDYHLDHDHDYSRSSGLPFGTFCYLLSYPAMVKACELKALSDTEVWGGYFTEGDRFRWGTMEVEDPEVRFPELRVSVDTPADFELVTRIFDELYRPGEIFTLREIVALCRAKPELPAINAEIEQKPGLAVKFKSASASS